MASETQPTLLLKLWVDKERNHLVVAEASGDFVDILFSFLTLPLATMVRLVSQKQPVEIGCLNNLYKSVDNLDVQYFWNNICKQMLLCPRSPGDALRQNLKLNVDSKGPTKYYICPNCYCSSSVNSRMLSTFPNSTCTCGRLMTWERRLEESGEVVKVNGVFVEDKATYLIYDDLKVMKGSLGDSLQQLIQLGYKDLGNLNDMAPKVGLNEILELFKHALISKTPLTDAFLANVESKPALSSCPKLGTKPEAGNCKMNLKITVSKSRNKVLCAEAGGDFIDFLLSLLTIPLGSILKLLNGNSNLGCIDNLYKSVIDLEFSCFQSSKTVLLNPGVASQFGCTNQPLNIVDYTPSYWYGSTVSSESNARVISTSNHQLKNAEAMKLFEPRSPDGKSTAIGFVRRPGTFAVWDDLRVTPLTSPILFLQKLNISLDDLEEHVVSIGETEALNLLRASLTSKTALTDGLFLLMKKPKEVINLSIKNC